MFCFTLYFQKDVAEYIVVLHCINFSFWNLKSLSFAFILCTTRCHSLYHSLSFVLTRCHSLSFIVTHSHSLSLVVLLVVTRCHSLYHSLSFVVIRSHSLSLVIIHCHSFSFVVTRCTTRCHSLPFAVPLVVTRCHSLSLVVTRCTTRLCFYKRSISNVWATFGKKKFQRGNQSVQKKKVNNEGRKEYFHKIH